MLDFSQVQARGMQRAMVIAQGGDPPPHTYILEPIIQQLLGPDYCADNGAMLTPHEAQGMGSLLGQMTMVMDGLEQQKAAGVAELEAAMEAVNDMAYQLARYQLIHRCVFIGAAVVALLASQAFIAWLV